MRRRQKKKHPVRKFLRNMIASLLCIVIVFCLIGSDPKTKRKKGMMREVCDAGGAIFFSTHVLEVAEKLCDKVAIIKSGKLIRSGIMDDEIQVDYLEKTEEENSESSSENEDYQERM